MFSVEVIETQMPFWWVFKQSIPLRSSRMERELASIISTRQAVKNKYLESEKRRVMDLDNSLSPVER